MGLLAIKYAGSAAKVTAAAGICYGSDIKVAPADVPDEVADEGARRSRRQGSYGTAGTSMVEGPGGGRLLEGSLADEGAGSSEGLQTKCSRGLVYWGHCPSSPVDCVEPRDDDD